MRFREKKAKGAMSSNSLAVEINSIHRAGLIRGAWMAGIGCATILLVGIALDTPSILPHLIYSALLWTALCLGGQLIEAASTAKYRKLASGLAGEEGVYKLLAGIDSGFHVLNGVLLPNSRSRTGHTEADFVLIGKKALYLVETKNNSGRIEAVESPPSGLW